jgi:WD40 repeat protein
MYDAFISYSQRADSRIARALRSVVQSIGRPWWKLRSLDVYLDASSLTANPDLWGTIEQALSDSRYLILLASPEAATSHWVDKEVSWWLDHKGTDTLLIALTDGSLTWSSSSEDFAWDEKTPLPPSLKTKFRVEPLWVSLTAYRSAPQNATKRNQDFLDRALNLAAAIHGRRKEDLYSDELREQRWILRWAYGAAGVLLVLTICAVTLYFFAEQQRKASLANETRALAALSDTALKRGNSVDAVQLALVAWPRKGDDTRPQMKRVITALNSALSEEHERIRFAEHSDPVGSALFSPDGTRIVTASDDTAARIWDAERRVNLKTLPHEKLVKFAAFSPDGTRIVTASDDGIARIWDGKTGKQLHRLKDGDSGAVYSALFSPDGTRVVAAYDDKKVRIWEASTGGLLREWTAHGESVYFAAYSPDGTRIVTASKDKTARIWDAQTGGLLGKLSGHNDAVYSAAYSPDGTSIVTASEDKIVRVWDANTRKKRFELLCSEPVHAAAFSPDGKRIVTASYDNIATIWDAKTGAVLVELKGHNQVVNFAAFSPDGTRVVTASDDKTARIWDTDAPKVILSDKHWVNSAAFSPDGTRIVTASRGGTVRILDADSGEQYPIELKKAGGEGQVAERHQRGAASDGQGPLCPGSVSSDGLAPTQSASANSNVYSVAYSPDGSRIVTASEDNMARIWEAQTGRLLGSLEHDSQVDSAAFSPDGTRIVTASDDGIARVWDVNTRKLLVCLKGSGGIVHHAAFSPDGMMVVAAYEDKKARIWNANTGRQLNELEEHNDIVYSAVFNPDGARIVTASGDGTVRIWDAKTGTQLTTLQAHHEVVYSAMFSKDGKRIVTASKDGTARVWEVATGINLSVLSGHTREVFTAEFSRDDAHIVTASADGTARVWNYSPPPPDPFTAACARLATISSSLNELAERYGLTGLKPICGLSAPNKIVVANIQE